MGPRATHPPRGVRGLKATHPPTEREGVRGYGLPTRLGGCGAECYPSTRHVRGLGATRFPSALKGRDFVSELSHAMTRRGCGATGYPSTSGGAGQKATHPPSSRTGGRGARGYVLPVHPFRCNAGCGGLGFGSNLLMPLTPLRLSRGIAGTRT